MNVRITFRHMDSSEAVKVHAREKLVKLQKFLREPMTANMTLSLEKLEHVVETRIASGGARHEARESSGDMYTSIDKVVAKLERQIRGTKGVKQAKTKRSGATLRGGKKPVPELTENAAETSGSAKPKRTRSVRARPEPKAAGTVKKKKSAR